MKLKFDVPVPPAGAMERTIAIGAERLRSAKTYSMPMSRLIALQLGSFSPLYWVTQFFALFAMLCVRGSKEADTEAGLAVMIVYAGVISLLACPELMRGISCKMSEIERSCRISASRLMAANLLIIAAADIVALIPAALVVAARFGTNIAIMLTGAVSMLFLSRFLTLFALRILKAVKSRAGALSLSLISSVAVAAVYIRLPWRLSLWITLAAISFALLAIEVTLALYRLENRKEKCLWNCV